MDVFDKTIAQCKRKGLDLANTPPILLGIFFKVGAVFHEQVLLTAEERQELREWVTMWHRKPRGSRNGEAAERKLKRAGVGTWKPR